MRVGVHRIADRMDVLVTLFAAAATEDKAAERRKTRFALLAFFSGLAAFFSLFLLAASVLFIFLFLCLFSLLVTFIVMAMRSGRYDLDDRKLASILRLLNVLRADVPGTERVHLMVDFRTYQKGGKLLSKEGGLFSQRRYLYEQRWLDLRARLADGNALVASLTDRVRRREKPKRKRTKITERLSTQARLLLRFDKRYGNAQTVMERLRSLPPPRQLKCAPPAARGRSVRISARTPVTMLSTAQATDPTRAAAGDAILRLLRFLYRGISAARRAA